MELEDKLEFSEALMSTAEIYNKILTVNLFQLYFDNLFKFPLEDILKAFDKHIIDPKHGTFFPKPADIVRNIYYVNRRTNDNPERDRRYSYMNNQNTEVQNESIR